VPRAHTVPGVLRQQRQQCSWRVPWLQRLFICGCSRSSSQDGCRQQRELVLQLAGTAFCDDDPVHLALLQAVHHAFTGEVRAAGTYMLLSVYSPQSYIPPSGCYVPIRSQPSLPGPSD